VLEPTFDVDAYFARIGYSGPRTPTSDVLARITERHTLSIPFENLDILLGRPIVLDVPSIEAKLVHGRRGGYCFEHNTLLGGVLRQLGFDVVSLGARARWMVPAAAVTARTHMLLSVAADGGRRLVDGGFGGVGVTAPLRLDFDGEQPSLFEAQRIVAASGGRLLQAKLNGEWRDLYVFTNEPQHAVDYEMANWFTSTHPGSRFQQNLIVTAAEPGVRSSLFNRELSIYQDGRVEKTVVDDPDHLLEVLATRFRLAFPAGTRFGPAGSPWAR
jgi:N-hydroxyarylamine O-acetyltransferase